MANPVVSYNNVEGGYNGVGNIDEYPLFVAESYLLADGSPCVDAGDTSSVYNDIEDPENTGSALFPSKGGLRNDMGAYGGPGAALLPSFGTIYVGLMENDHLPGHIKLYPNPCSGKLTIHGQGEMAVYNILGEKLYSKALLREKNTFQVDIPEGMYIILLKDNKQTLISKLVVRY
jgi:hypothetical protein